MSLLSLFNPFAENTRLFDMMLDKLGMRARIAARADAAGVMRRASNRCLTCAEPGACAKWLQERETAEEAPSYCRNHDLFERLKHEISDDMRRAA